MCLAFFCQNPDSKFSSVRESLAAIYRKGGVGALWHGTSAGVMKTVPKYCVAVTVKASLIATGGRVARRFSASDGVGVVCLGSTRDVVESTPPN